MEEIEIVLEKENGYEQDVSIIEKENTDETEISIVDKETSENEITMAKEMSGISDYEILTNLPKINNVELKGNKTTEDLGLQAKGNYANKDEIPTKTSQLENDSGYLTEHQDLSTYAKKEELPTKTSDLENDSGFLTEHQDLTEYAKKTDIPNVSNFITKDVSDLTNYYNKSQIDNIIGNIVDGNEVYY